jgi:hypothetical protein
MWWRVHPRGGASIAGHCPSRKLEVTKDSFSHEGWKRKQQKDKKYEDRNGRIKGNKRFGWVGVGYGRWSGFGWEESEPWCLAAWWGLGNTDWLPGWLPWIKTDKAVRPLVLGAPSEEKKGLGTDLWINVTQLKNGGDARTRCHGERN